jgi:hypothetical protein
MLSGEKGKKRGPLLMKEQKKNVEDTMFINGIKYRPSPSEKDKRMRPLLMKEQKQIPDSLDKLWKIK